MSGGSQHNPNGRQAQLGAGWSPLQLQVANFLARAPQAHMAERGHTWHTPTPPPHLYHVPAPSPPDPLQAMKATGNSVFRHTATPPELYRHTATPPELYRHTPTPPDKHLMSGMREEDRGKPMKAGGNSVFRHTATPPELYRHTPTPPDKHLMRHTPSPGDVKAGAALPPAELYPHLGPGRDKLVRPEDLLYARGVDLSVSSARGANGAPASAAPPPAHQPAPATAAAPAPAPAPALSVRDAPTINSLIARHQPRPGHARVDALLERLSAPASPHSVIVHHPSARAAPTPSPPSSNEDSADSCGAPPGSKRKRKPERTIRVSAAPPPAHAPLPSTPPRHTPPPIMPPTNTISTTSGVSTVENGEHSNGPDIKEETQEDVQEPEADTKPTDMEIEDTQIPQKPPSPEPHARRKEKTRSNSAETIDDIAAMVACDQPVHPPLLHDKVDHDEEVPETIDQLKNVLASPSHEEPKEAKVNKVEEPKIPAPRAEEKEKEVEMPPEAAIEAPAPLAAAPPPPAAAPKRRSARTSNSETTNVPVESPSEAKPAEPEEGRSATPTAASFVEVENQLEKMFAGIEEESPKENKQFEETNKPKKRRKSAPTKGESKPGRRAVRASTTDRRKGGKKKPGGGNKQKKQKEQKEVVKDAYAYDSGSNASSSRSRGPYIQIRGPRDSPRSVSVINASTGEDDTEAASARRKPSDYRNGLRARGLHASTLGLRYDATTPDLTWTCAFCETGPHASGLGDLFGPYTVETDCEEYRALDEATRRRYESSPSPNEVWFHEACAVWAPGLVAAGARLWGLASAVWVARGAKCGACGKAGAGIACQERGCRARTHVPCAKNTQWWLDEEEFKAYCPRHAPPPGHHPPAAVA